MAKKKTEVPEELQNDVVSAKKRLDDAKALLAESQSEYDEALASHAAAVKALQPEADPLIHVFLEGVDGAHTLIEHPDAKNKLTRITVDGKNFEHVSDGENGVWIYRRM